MASHRGPLPSVKVQNRQPSLRRGQTVPHFIGTWILKAKAAWKLMSISQGIASEQTSIASLGPSEALGAPASFSAF